MRDAWPYLLELPDTNRKIYWRSLHEVSRTNWILNSIQSLRLVLLRPLPISRNVRQFIKYANASLPKYFEYLILINFITEKNIQLIHNSCIYMYVINYTNLFAVWQQLCNFIAPVQTTTEIQANYLRNYSQQKSATKRARTVARLFLENNFSQAHQSALYVVLLVG